MKRTKIEYRYFHCIAFHNFDMETTRFKDWLEFILESLKPLGFIPKEMGIRGEKSIKTAKMISFKGGYKKLYLNNFENLFSIGINFAHESCESYEIGDFLAYTVLSWDEEKRNSRMIICLDANLCNKNIEYFRQLGVDLWQFCKAKFGYYYYMKGRTSSAFYPGGITGYFPVEAPIDREILEGEKRVDAWRIYKTRYEVGQIRDIYELNFLTEENIKWEVEPGINVETWIRDDPVHRGTLVKENEELWSWIIDKKNIPVVRDSLTPSGFILSTKYLHLCS